MESIPALVALAALAALLLVPAVLGARAADRSQALLRANGKLAVATVEEVSRGDDLLVRISFELPDGKTMQRSSVALPLWRKIEPGSRIVVRYNPKLPAICQLEPDLPVPCDAKSAGKTG